MSVTSWVQRWCAHCDSLPCGQHACRGAPSICRSRTVTCRHTDRRRSTQMQDLEAIYSFYAPRGGGRVNRNSCCTNRCSSNGGSTSQLSVVSCRSECMRGHEPRHACDHAGSRSPHLGAAGAVCTRPSSTRGAAAWGDSPPLLYEAPWLHATWDGPQVSPHLIFRESNRQGAKFLTNLGPSDIPNPPDNSRAAR